MQNKSSRRRWKTGKSDVLSSMESQSQIQLNDWTTTESFDRSYLETLYQFWENWYLYCVDCMTIYLRLWFLSPAICNFQHKSPVHVLLDLHPEVETPVLCSLSVIKVKGLPSLFLVLRGQNSVFHQWVWWWFLCRYSLLSWGSSLLLLFFWEF